MKKMLLLLVCLTTFAWLHADEVTIDFSKQGYSSGQKITDVKVNDYINITFAVGTGNNDPIFHTTGNAIRFYGGNTMTVSCKDATLKEIVFTTPTSGSGSTFNKAFTSTLGTFNSTTKTWIGENVVSTQFNNGTSNSTAQVRIISLKITYTISGSENQASTPSISPASGAVEAGTKVTISCSDAEAEIHYTTNGDDPTAESAIYTAETDITVNEAMTVKAIAVKKGLDNSEIATATYTIKKTTVADIAEFISLAEASPVDEYAIANPVTAVYQNGQNLYVKDSSGWLLVYGSLDGKTYANGDVIAAGIKGKSQDFSGTYELSDPVTSTFAAGVAGTPVEPEEVSNVSGDIVNHYVVVKGVTISGINKQNGKATTADATEIALYNKFNITGFEAGSNLTVKGFVNVYRNTTIQLIPIEITTAQGEEIVAAPTFSLAAGNVAEGTEVSIACATEGATIHYTTDGTDPDANSAEYTDPIVIDKAMTIKAIAVKEGMSNSDIVEAAYKIIVATPMFDPAPGAVKKGTEVTITCATEGAILMYQVNDDIQEGASPVTVVINEATTIEVIASKDGYVDSEAKVTYSIEGEAPMSYTAQFDFSDPTKLNPAQDYPSFEGMNPSGSVTRVLVAGVEFTNNYVVAEFVAPGNATATNTPQIMYNADAENNKIAFVRAFKNSGLKITGLRQLQVEKIEITGTDLNNVLYNGTAVNSSAKTELVWERPVVSALAETSENDVVEFKISSSKAVSINTIKVTTLDITNGVDDIIVDENAPVEYYNLQGVRVDNPENGIYIRRQGSKVSKVLVK